MSYLTSVSPGISNAGSGNAAYISGLVMMDVMMSWWKGRSVRCRRWDRPFYLFLLLFGNSYRSDWRITTLVPFDYLFLSLVSFFSLCDEKIEGSVHCRRRVHMFYLSSLLTLCTSCWADFCVTMLLLTGSILLFMPFLYLRDKLIGVLAPLFRQFYLFHCYHLGNLCREVCCEDVTVIQKFSPFSLFPS